MSVMRKRGIELVVEGDINAKDCLLRFKSQGRTLAVASIFRDLENLQAELAMERAASRATSDKTIWRDPFHNDQ